LGAPINTAAGEYFPSLTRDGTIYFTRGDRVARTNFIYRSRLVGGKYAEPQKLGPQVNSIAGQFNAFVAIGARIRASARLDPPGCSQLLLVASC